MTCLFMTYLKWSVIQMVLAILSIWSMVVTLGCVVPECILWFYTVNKLSHDKMVGANVQMLYDLPVLPLLCSLHSISSKGILA